MTGSHRCLGASQRREHFTCTNRSVSLANQRLRQASRYNTLTIDAARCRHVTVVEAQSGGTACQLMLTVPLGRYLLRPKSRNSDTRELSCVAEGVTHPRASSLYNYLYRGSKTTTNRSGNCSSVNLDPAVCSTRTRGANEHLHSVQPRQPLTADTFRGLLACATRQRLFDRPM